VKKSLFRLLLVTLFLGLAGNRVCSEVGGAVGFDVLVDPSHLTLGIGEEGVLRITISSTGYKGGLCLVDAGYPYGWWGGYGVLRGVHLPECDSLYLHYEMASRPSDPDGYLGDIEAGGQLAANITMKIVCSNPDNSPHSWTPQTIDFSNCVNGLWVVASDWDWDANPDVDKASIGRPLRFSIELLPEEVSMIETVW
jgi:hypothetical protein